MIGRLGSCTIGRNIYRKERRERREERQQSTIRGRRAKGQTKIPSSFLEFTQQQRYGGRDTTKKSEEEEQEMRDQGRLEKRDS